jgi:hypothetical protein
MQDDDINPRLNALAGDREVYRIAQELNNAEFNFADGIGAWSHASASCTYKRMISPVRSKPSRAGSQSPISTRPAFTSLSRA